jgi:hypothetical protein
MKFLLLIFLLSGCASNLTTDMKPSTFYKRDMLITVNGYVGEGVLVVPKAAKYDIEVTARGDLDLFVFTTCNREWTKERAWTADNDSYNPLFFWKRYLDSKRKVSFTYTPNTVEANDPCPIWLGGFEKIKGRHSWAYIDYRTEKETLPATILCNGKNDRYIGASVCQSKEGLIQAVTFEKEVVTSPDEDCPISANRGTYFEIPLKKAECVYIFRTIEKPRQDHRLTTLGYEEILIRE